MIFVKKIYIYCLNFQENITNYASKMDIILLTTSLKAKNDVNKNSTSIDSPLIYGSTLIGEMKRRAKILSYERGHPKILKLKFPPTFICSPISTIYTCKI